MTSSRQAPTFNMSWHIDMRSMQYWLITDVMHHFCGKVFSAGINNALPVIYAGLTFHYKLRTKPMTSQDVINKDR